MWKSSGFEGSVEQAAPSNPVAAVVNIVVQHEQLVDYMEAKDFDLANNNMQIAALCHLLFIRENKFFENRRKIQKQEEIQMIVLVNDDKKGNRAGAIY